MPDSIQPVGAQVQPLDFSKGIGTLSSILGLQQQQQNLQTGQINQATAQAESQQAQQKNAELQKAEAISLNGAKSGRYTNPDGSLNRQKMADDISTVAPTYGNAYATQLLSQANEVVQNQQAHQNLTIAQKKEIGDTFASLASDPQVDNTKFIDATEKLRQAHPNDPNFSRLLTSMTTRYPATAPAAIQQQILGQWAASAQGSPQVTPTQVDTGPAIQGAAQNRFTGALSQSGPGVVKGLAPTDQPAYKQAASAAAATGASRASGVASSDIDRANQVSANIKPAQAGIQTTQQIDDLADQIHSGKYAAWLSKQAAAAGIQDSTFARQLLEKDLGIVKTQLTAAAPSDSRAATILSGTPDATSDPQTIHGAMDYVRGSLRQNLAQGQNLSAYKAKHPDLSGFQGADDTFTGAGGPLVHEFLSLKGKDQQAAFYRRNFSSPQEALKFRNQAYAASHTLGLDNGNNR
jgi:hypothetical protein